MKRKFFPAFLALCLILTMLPMSALADERPGVAPEAFKASNEDKVAEPVTDPAADPVAKSAAEPVAKSATDPAADPAAVAEKVAAIGDTKYDTLAEAVTKAGTTGSVIIKLLANTTEDITIPEKAKITLEIPEGMKLINKSGDTISNHGTLTITGAGTVDNVSPGKGALVNYPDGTVTLKDGITLTRSQEKSENSWYAIKNMGKVTIEKANVFVKKENGGSSSLIDNGWYDTTGSNDNDRKTARPENKFATLTIAEGTFSSGMNTIKNDDCGILTIKGGSFSNVTGANVLNWNETTITGGSFSDSSSDTGLIANGYLNDTTDVGKITIKGGTFKASDNGNGFLLALGQGAKPGGKFRIEGGTFNGIFTNVKDMSYKFEITGGTFSADPFAPTFDLSKSGGVKADNLVFSGTVDPRTYTVTDPVVQSQFKTLLTTEKPADNVARLPEQAAEVMYVADGKKLSFGNIKFANLADDGNYIIQQINPALSYLSSKNAYAGDSEIQTYIGSEVKNGLYFMISDQPISDHPGDITFKIAPVSAPSVAAANIDTKLELPENAATYTITNSVVFKPSALPEKTTVEVPATVTTNGNTVTAKAEASKEVVNAAIASAAGGAVTIETKASDTNVNAVEVTLTNDVVTALASSEAKVKEVVLETPVGTVTLSDNALKTIADKSNTNGATVNVKQANVENAVAAFEVDVKSNGGNVAISKLDTPIKLSFNIGKDLKNPVLMYLDNTTNTTTTFKPIASSRYDAATGIITGETTHLSTFAAVNLNSIAVENDGVGCKVALTAANLSGYLTIQVTNGNANSIYTVQADSKKKVVLYVKSGTVLNVWETSVLPTFESGQFKPKEEPIILVNNQTVTAS